MSDVATNTIAGVLLAGGQGKRMGGDRPKCLLSVNNRPILETVIQRATPQVGKLVFSVHKFCTAFEPYPITQVTDIASGHQGPLIGVLSALTWIKTHEPSIQWVASFATDTPFFPLDLVQKLAHKALHEHATLAYAVADGREHPVFALWSTALIEELQEFVVRQKRRRMRDFHGCCRSCFVDFTTAGRAPFFNINRPADLQHAQKLAENYFR